MPTRPIGLAGLRGFEAAGRLLSFTRAADELALTQSSISRQVAALERQVGRPLFVRRTRALELTPAGARLLHVVQQALQQVDRAVADARGHPLATRVTLSCFASFASLWLIPRLPRFQHDHPAIEIRIDATDRLVDLDAEQIDIAIRLARPVLLPPHALPLHEEEVTPALSPLLAERGARIATPADLMTLPLLATDIGPNAGSGWPQWFEFAGVAVAPPPPRLMFTFVDQAVQAAVRGQGVVLARSPFVDDLAAAGDLVLPFPRLRLRTGARYALLTSAQSRDAAHVTAFREWVATEFSRGPERHT